MRRAADAGLDPLHGPQASGPRADRVALVHALRPRRSPAARAQGDASCPATGRRGRHPDRRPAARVSGRVAIDDAEVAVDVWDGVLNHNWGAEHAERWIWLHGAARGEWI